MYLVFLGAGRNQLPYILEAKARGIKIIAIDRDPFAEGKKYADIFLNQRIDDVENIFQKLKNYNIGGVLSEQSDSAMLSVAYLNTKFNLRGLQYKEAIKIRDKLKQRELLTEIGIKQPKYIIANDRNDSNFKALKFLHELIIKPRVGQSSIGVNLLKENKEIIISNEYIIEEYVSGLDISVDGFIADEIFFTCYCEKFKYKNTII